MLLRMSTLFLRTLREDPADAEVPSHRLLVRAGYIRRAAPGIYSWLPLGYLVYRNVERIVREEMDAAGFQEVHFPALLPREPYEATGRWTEYGDNLFRLKDRKGNDYLLGPDPRGDVHAPGEGPVLLVQGPAAVDLPDPDEVPRRGPAPRRHPARPRVRHEGLVLLRRRRRRAASAPTSSTATPTSGPSTGSASTTSSSRRCPGRWAAAERGVPRADRGRRGHLRAVHARATTRRTSRPSTTPRAARPSTGTASPPRTSRTPRTPRRSRPSSPLANDRFPRADGRPWTAADTLKNVVVTLVAPRRHPRAARASACPATARST